MESPLASIEFPADDAERARNFWAGLLGLPLEPRTAQARGGTVIHPGEIWAICKDSEGSPLALAAVRTG
jgi:hypothetical protein